MLLEKQKQLLVHTSLGFIRNSYLLLGNYTYRTYHMYLPISNLYEYFIATFDFTILIYHLEFISLALIYVGTEALVPVAV